MNKNIIDNPATNLLRRVCDVGSAVWDLASTFPSPKASLRPLSLRPSPTPTLTPFVFITLSTPTLHIRLYAEKLD